MATTLERSTTSVARKNLPICVLDEKSEQVEITTERLAEAGYPVTGTTDLEEALQKIRLGDCRVILTDLTRPGLDGLAFLDKALQIDPGISVILTTGFYSTDFAIEAIKRGAYDYISKPIDYARLEKALDELAESFTRRSEIRNLEDKLIHNLEFQGIVGKSPAIIEVFESLRKIARHYTAVLITGPTGSGKELVARALHQLSPVTSERFAVCNCSAFVDTLLESELFGHIRGSFPGATETRPGLFEHANGGSVFINEIGKTSLQVQAKLLRAIQDHEIQRIGSPDMKKVDVRLIATTDLDLRFEVLAGHFREDLFRRLSANEIHIPGLVERPEDVPLLVQHFVNKYSKAYGKPLLGLSRRAQIVLLQHAWPGNVGELEDVISSAAIAAKADFIDVADLPAHLQQHRPRSGTVGEDWRPLPLDEVRRTHIERVLEMCHGNRVRAAKVLGIGRTSLYRFLKRKGRQETVARRG